MFNSRNDNTIKVVPRTRRKFNLFNFLVSQSIIIGFAGILIFFSIKNYSFLQWQNIVDIIMRMSILSGPAFGVMLALVCKGIDLSSGTTMGLVAITLASAISAGKSFGVSLFFAFLVGSSVGIINALLIAKANLNPFIATISVLFIGNSIEKCVTRGGLPIYLYPSPKSLDRIYRGNILGIPTPIFIMVIMTLLLFFFLEKSKYGRKLRAAGENIKASRLAGIPVRFYYGLAYFFAAICATIGGIVVLSQIRAAQPLVGESYLWDAIGAAYLSTIMSPRGQPNVLGTLFGALVMATVANGFTLMGLSFYWKEFAKGVIILILLLVSTLKKRYEGRCLY
ncbi:MAG TPA: ABC transporter permease [Defluviitoga sp.]|nr:ABC transporter permease [Defluviitoga sp.]